MKILAVDLSFAKTGFAVLTVKERKVEIVELGLIKSNKNKSSSQRIDSIVTVVKALANKHDVAAIVKERAIMTSHSTTFPILKTHGVFEHELDPLFVTDDLAIASAKAWGRAVSGAGGRDTSKQMVAEAVEKYFERRIPQMWNGDTLIDDISDAIAVGVTWLENADYIDVKYERKKR